VITVSGTVTIVGLLMLIFNRSSQLMVSLDIAVALSGATTGALGSLFFFGATVNLEMGLCGLG
jgi:hypothetical protein